MSSWIRRTLQRIPNTWNSVRLRNAIIPEASAVPKKCFLNLFSPNVEICTWWKKLLNACIAPALKYKETCYTFQILLANSEVLSWYSVLWHYYLGPFCNGIYLTRSCISCQLPKIETRLEKNWHVFFHFSLLPGGDFHEGKNDWVQEANLVSHPAKFRILNSQYFTS